jgi:signal transduction histidine kinase
MAIEQDRLLRQTQRAVEARDRAVSIVSHDLRNPLSTIQICANALLDPEPAPPSGIRHMAELIARSAEWMQHILRDLLDRTNLDSGHVTLSKRTIVVTDILTAIEDVFGPIAAQGAIELVLNAEDDLPVLEADPDRLLQALANLMSNAVKFTPRGGRVELLATVEILDVGEPASPSVDRDIRFSVRDTGPGIAPENIDHVFDWFWRAPGGGSDGAGLGLGIAKALIEAHDARLHVDSVPGHGSTFWFTLCGSSAVPSFAELPVL